jgi:cellulose synthase/poly-beta-1,6-N-acetylglucosamine synthase-like glycosyltransferase
MLAISQIILLLVGLLLAVPVSVVFLQVLLALPRRPASRMPEGLRGRVAVLVPAHDEDRVIGKTLASISRQLETGDRLVVIADNCSDRTAEVARECGAEVTVRTDAVLRGKGYAMDHGLKFLQKTGPRETVIFVDADCDLGDGCINHLERMCSHSRRPTQAAYLMVPPEQRQEIASLISFAWRVKNLVRPLGWHRMNFPCQLQGSGMAFPWDVTPSMSPAGADLAEDTKLGLDLALIGQPPQFCPEAVVTSHVAAGGIPSYSQRARWEHGVIELMVHYVPRLLAKSWSSRSGSLAAMALDLSVPPLALFTMIIGVYLILTVLLLFISGVSGPAAIASTLSALFFVSVMLAWWRYGRETLPLRRLVFAAPVYAIRKLPLYTSLFLNRQREWIKGKRELGG